MNELTWNHFRDGVDHRFTILPVQEFQFRITYVPIILPREAREFVAVRTTDITVDGLKAEPACDLTALHVELNQSATITSGKEEPYVSVIFPHPVFDFSMFMGPTVFLVGKKNASMEDLVHTVKLLEPIIRNLLSPGEDGDQEGPLAKAGVLDKAIELSLSFEHGVRLGRRLGKAEEASNLMLFKKMARLDLADPEKTELTPLAAVQPNTVKRGDVALLFTKDIKHRARRIRIEYQGPWNVTHKDVDLGVSYTMGGHTAPFQPQDLYDLKTPFFDFYRDLILKRFFADLFYDVEVIGRVPK
ncbi:hypothetical protein HEK616_07940 [Streptomyces nigrescens]|uniref:Uncharacterized protein n=1 Tax=Streptomyces nigrescens TaxID=1920 RepID=A0ABM7ZLN0_STRNI|nr:hypothetical protein [Streptomyces nigrescens]BDM67307.1 hypothetical protein HEK616_07940 [Streptomyces nigrescens]